MQRLNEISPEEMEFFFKQEKLFYKRSDEELKGVLLGILVAFLMVAPFLS